MSIDSLNFVRLLAIIVFFRPDGTFGTVRYKMLKPGYKLQTSFINTKIESMSATIYEQCAHRCSHRQYDVNCVAFLFLDTDKMCHFFDKKPNVNVDFILGEPLDRVFIRRG